MFVENERVFNFNPVKNMTLEEIKDDCFNHFTTNLKMYVMQPGDPHPKITTNGIHQYNHFKNEFGKNVSYNSKNREFYQLYTDLKEHVKNNLYHEVKCAEGQKVEPAGAHYMLSQNDKTFIRIIVKPEDTTIFYLNDFMELFGAGEFPFMGISIVRIGNHDYYFYTISR